EGELSSCWTDDMTLGWVYQYWNDPEREALDDKLNGGGKVERHEIASKTQMFTERYMVDWLLQNSVGPLWLAVCRKHGWTPQVEADGTLARLEARRVEWRAKREAEQVEPTELMPLHDEAERRWAYYVPQEIPTEAVEHAVDSVRDLKLLDPAVGSGHFLVVAVDLLVALYREEARHRGEQGQPQWDDRAIVERVLSENLHGIDLDPRAVQIAAAGLWLKAQQIAPGARPPRLNLVASNLRLAGLPEDDAGLTELRQQVERETGIPGALTDRVVQALKGADHLGSLLKVDAAVEAALREHEQALGKAVADQGGLFEGFSPQQQRLEITTQEAKASLLARLEGFLATHSRSEDLGLRLLGEQLAAGVRFVRMVREGTYDLVVGNPPYQGTSKLADAAYVKKEYALGKADLYAAFLQRGIELAREGGVSALLTMRNWMFIKQYAGLREWLLETWDLRGLGDFDRGAFEDVPDEVVSVVGSIFRRSPPRPEPSMALQPTPRDDRTRDSERTARKRAAVLCHVGRYEFEPAALKVVPEWPLVYWWGHRFLADYAEQGKIGEIAPIRYGLSTQNNTRWLRRCWEVPTRKTMLKSFSEPRGWDGSTWVPYIKGAAGSAWMDTISDVILWRYAGGELWAYPENRWGRGTDYYFQRGVAFVNIGSSFSARAHRTQSIFGHVAGSIFGMDTANATALLNCHRSRYIMESFNPTLHFLTTDVERLPATLVPNADEIFATIESAFTTHESHREPSVEFRTPGPSPWRHAQAWAQFAVDRPADTPLPPYTEQLDPEPPTDHLSYALGVALGRFSPAGEGILDPATADLSHALPAAILFLDGSLPDDDTQHDSLAHPATAPLHAAWDTHAAAITTKRTALRDYLRLDFFADVHRTMYDNRPIHWPLSSGNKTFVAWINIHRFTASTLRTLLADHLHPALARIDGQLDDLRTARDSGDAKLSRAAEKHLATLTKAREELHRFIGDVTQCGEQGPLPPGPKTPPREANAPYDPDLDDGVMINSAALYPLLSPQWKDPVKWWKELATAKGRKDYDWSHLAARYWPTRVDAKCQQDPSLGVAHRCFWKYHPARAYAWELRLQDEIEPGFTIDEPGSDEHRTRLLAEQPDEAAAIRDKEAKRRERKAAKAAKAHSELFDGEGDESESDD
ncbi:MAG: BREX-6 system adenine-specific DNA-methyltransferase PglX, partial [Nannocystaceae bacterium]